MKLLLVSLMLASFAWADQVTLTNGDRITGTILKSDTKTLELKTEHLGKLTIDWDAISGITATGPLYLTLKDGQTVIGTVETVDGKFNVRTQTAGVVTAAKDSVQTVRNDDEQKAYQAEIDHYRSPRLVDLWTGNLDLGYAANRGNSSTDTFTLATSANRATPRDKIEVHYTSIFAATDVTGSRQTTANAKRGGISYNLNLNKRAFVFGLVDLEADQFQSLDLRFAPAGGVGYHAIATMPTQLDFRIGAAANSEYFSTGLHRNSAEILLGQGLTHKFSPRTSIQEQLVFFPNVSDSGNYRINFDTTAVTAIRRWFSWQFTVSDRFLSNPVPGRKKNDILFSTGVRLSFTK
jgi:putative salt-induced outer membrane protein YdiY